MLTAAARAAGLAHGVAPALTTRLSGVMAQALPHGDGRHVALKEGKNVAAPDHFLAARVRAWSSALNDKAARAYNQHTG